MTRSDIRVLIISSSVSTADALCRYFSGRFGRIDMARDASEARRKLGTGAYYDMVVLDSPVGGESGADIAIYAADNSFCSVIMAVKAEFFDEMCYKVEGSGVLVLQKPLSDHILHQATTLAQATRVRLRRAERQNESLRKKMDEIKLVARAKLLLMEKLRMTESEAHKFIEKQAMDMRQSRAEVARNLIRTYEN